MLRSEDARNSNSVPLNDPAPAAEMNNDVSCCFYPCFAWLFGGPSYEAQPSPSSTEARSPGHVEAGQYLYQAPVVTPFPGPRRCEDERGSLLPKGVPSSAPIQDPDQGRRAGVSHAASLSNAASKSGAAQVTNDLGAQQQQQQQQQQQAQRMSGNQKKGQSGDNGRKNRREKNNNAPLQISQAGVERDEKKGDPSTVTNLVPQDEDDDFCPTCLEVYTEDNPKIWTECRHHFHMPCIYEWKERSDTCPMCERKMVFPDL